MIPVSRQIASEIGIEKCSSCGADDITYGLFGSCLNCDNPIPKNENNRTLRYSIRVFMEFLVRYDEMYSSDSKMVAISFCKGLVDQLSNGRSLQNNDVLKLQSIIYGFKKIGGNEIGGAINLDKNQQGLEVLENNYRGSISNKSHRLLSLAITVGAIKFIMDWPVENEYVL
jgi:hypothetical protein